ncbi:MAG TPA: hypothetical protein VFO65_05915 [Acidimicrobiales bacterium]|nr:hypothetical protein [Acidimicrobiales bacterium]
MAEERSPLDQVVEMLVYAPVGLAVTATQSIPELVAKGRERLSGQVALARFIGQFAVTKGERHARRRLNDLARSLESLLPTSAPPAPPPASRPAPPAPVAAVAATPAPALSPNGPVPASVTEPAAPAATGDDGGERATAALAIPAYDTLSASQVVQRLAGLSGEELEAVRHYEAGTRGRRTILSKIAQLQSGPAA